MKIHLLSATVAGLVALAAVPPANASEIKVLTAGAYKQVVLALVPDFEKQTGHKVVVDNGTTGATWVHHDVTFSVPEMIASGKLFAGSHVNLASVGVGVVVKEGAPKPDIGTVEKFKEALLAAKSVAYIDPASGGSSGIYVDKLLAKLGIADQIKPKAKLKQGGNVRVLSESLRAACAFA